ncbi:MAG: UDP-N-acetylmuramate:L-alanyl-gamma-D-glutamyl-meso-diaminopimelate ligase [Betaproteobacteria bacterium]|nr:UDP-N-acetylmuramate:L-alanyl-gamma-D-glutamyl-meso-diaminopimelate ligase [Betaproteobacteria bacterium]
MHIHILGICGTFMGGVAALAQAGGHRVTGCDAQVYPPMSEQLQALGIGLIEGFDASQLDLAPDLWVVGNAISRGNPLLEAILDAGQPYTSGPQWLAEHVLAGRWTLAVAGTHGKTTTSSMLAWILEQAGRRPGFLIGGVAQDFGVSARLGDGECFVVEADEYDTAFCDKRSKFVHYRPRTAILNNLEYDHADIFPDLAAIETQFHHLVRTVPRHGRLVVPADSASLQRVLRRGCWSELEHFGDGAAWSARGDEQEFEVLHHGSAVGRVAWRLMGAHNRANAVAAVAAAAHAGVEPDLACRALGCFQGVRRRMQWRGSAAGVEVYDDFAHHPTAIATTIAGLRRARPDGRILAVFEPRSNTMKLGSMKQQLPQALAEADLSLGYAGGIDWDLAQALEPLGARARAHRDLQALVDDVAASARPGDHVLVMSNGGFGAIHDRLLQALRERGAARGGAEGATGATGV